MIVLLSIRCKGESAKKDASSEAAAVSTEDGGENSVNTEDNDEHLANERRKAVTEISAIGAMHLDEQHNSPETTSEDGIIQVLDISSSTTDTQSASSVHRLPDTAASETRQADGSDTATENRQLLLSASSSSSSDQVSSSGIDASGPASASVEDVAEKHVNSVSNVDRVAVCLT